MKRTEKIKIIMAALCAVFMMTTMLLGPVYAETHTPGIHQGNVQNTASNTIRTSKGNADKESHEASRKASASGTSRTSSKADSDIIIRMGILFIVVICVLSAVSSVLRGDDIKLGPILFLLLVAGGAMLSLSR